MEYLSYTKNGFDKKLGELISLLNVALPISHKRLLWVVLKTTLAFLKRKYDDSIL
jgi:hypothetical protein